MQWIQDPRAVLTELFTSLCNIAFIPFKKNSVLPFTTLILICFSNRTGTSVDDGKARKELNTTSSAQFAALPLVKPVV